APALLAQAPIPDLQPPPYARIGDLFGWSCIAISLALLLKAAMSSPLRCACPQRVGLVEAR
ncbi:hypothetical protein ACYOEI_21910, partial [Singulisphaera rosea]